MLGSYVSYSSTPSTDVSRFLSLLTQIGHDFGYQILRFFAVTNPALRELGNSHDRPAAYKFYVLGYIRRGRFVFAAFELITCFEASRLDPLRDPSFRLYSILSGAIVRRCFSFRRLSLRL